MIAGTVNHGRKKKGGRRIGSLIICSAASTAFTRLRPEQMEILRISKKLRNAEYFQN